MEAQQNITNVAQLGGNVVSINNNTTIALNGGNMSGITTVPISQVGVCFVFQCFVSSTTTPPLHSTGATCRASQQCPYHRWVFFFYFSVFQKLIYFIFFFQCRIYSVKTNLVKTNTGQEQFLNKIVEV